MAYSAGIVETVHLIPSSAPNLLHLAQWRFILTVRTRPLKTTPFSPLLQWDLMFRSARKFNDSAIDFRTNLFDASSSSTLSSMRQDVKSIISSLQCLITKYSVKAEETLKKVEEHCKIRSSSDDDPSFMM